MSDNSEVVLHSSAILQLIKVNLVESVNLMNMLLLIMNIYTCKDSFDRDLPPTPSCFENQEFLSAFYFCFFYTQQY
jgi:hypothetical protein